MRGNHQSEDDDDMDIEASSSGEPAAVVASTPSGVQGAIGVPADEAAAETSPVDARGCNDSTTGDSAEKRQRLAALEELLGLSRASEIIEQIERGMPRQPVNHRQRRTAKLNDAKFHVAEAYSPPRMVLAAKRMGLRPGWSLDLSEVDESTGQPWDLSTAAAQKRAMSKQKEDEPAMLVVCPPCGPFSSWMNVNFSSKPTEEVREILWNAMRHLTFAVEMCIEQAKNGRFFLFEHPYQATSWQTGIMQRLLNMRGVMKFNFDFCTMGMKAKDANGEIGLVKKRTGLVTNSRHVAGLMEKAQCRGGHQHVVLQDGKPKACERYPDAFCDSVCLGVKMELEDEVWLNKIFTKVAEKEMIGSLLEVQEKFEAMAEPDEEEDEMKKYRELYQESDFIDDISSAALEKDLAIRARMTEMSFFKKLGVYTKEPRQIWMKVITTRWIDTNKGDRDHPDYRSRMVGREINRGKRDDLVAATPPLQSHRFWVERVCLEPAPQASS